MRTFTLQSRDGTELFGRAWPAKKPRAVVGLVHGLGEHSGRYDHVGETLAESGVSLYATDLRGHGESAGRRGHAENYDALMDDVDQLLELVKREHPDLPRFTLGHSLGGNIALVHAMKRAPNLAGVIASAPLLRLSFEPPAWKMFAMRIVNALGITLALPSGVEDQKLSRDEQVVEKKQSDPLSHKVVSSRLATDMLEHGRWLLKNAAAFPFPLLMIHGDADDITSCDATKSFAEQLTVEHRLAVLPDLYHEPFNEPERGEALRILTDWIANHS